MTGTIFLVVVAVILFGGGFLLKKANIEDDDYGISKKVGKGLQIATVVPLAIILLMCQTTVPENSVGIIWSPFGGTSETTLSEGWKTKTPFDTVYVISTEVQTATLEGITGQTKDSQYITMEIDVKYQVSESDAFIVFKQYKTLDNVADKFITPAVQRSIETVTTNYNIIDILGEKRNLVYHEIETELSSRFADVGITFKGINFNDTDADPQIEAAITAEAVATKEVTTAEQKKLKAQIDAETKVIEAQGEADANKILEAIITDKLLSQQWIEKWDGKLPLVTSGSDGGMILDLNNLTE